MSLDLTEWREAQQALARAERRYTELVEHATTASRSPTRRSG